MKISRKQIKTTIRKIILENQNSRESKVISLLSKTWEPSDIRYALSLGEDLGMFEINMDYELPQYTRFEIKYPTPAFKAAFNHAVNKENEQNAAAVQRSVARGYPPNHFLGGIHGQGMMMPQGEEYFVITSRYKELDRQ